MRSTGKIAQRFDHPHPPRLSGRNRGSKSDLDARNRNVCFNPPNELTSSARASYVRKVPILLQKAFESPIANLIPRRPNSPRPITSPARSRRFSKSRTAAGADEGQPLVPTTDAARAGQESVARSQLYFAASPSFFGSSFFGRIASAVP
jgi:hypothetical protein